MTYGSKAVMPIKIGLPTARSDHFFNPKRNDHALAESLDPIEENKEVATIKLADYQ